LLALAVAPPSGPPPPPPNVQVPGEAGPPLLPLGDGSGCAPERLVRLVVRNVSPGLPASDARAQPRVIYRRGAMLLRTEELPDPGRNGQTALFIISEPDIWAVDLSTRNGRHSTDPGPSFEVHAPVLPLTQSLPPLFRTLEFGCEAAFVAANAPQPQRVVPWGETTAALHSVTVGDQTVALLMDNRRATPLLISYVRQGKPVWVVRYDDYRADLPDRPDLFQPSRAFKFQEAPVSSPLGSPPPAPPPEPK
jgi:hypothetical protein